MAHLYPSDVIFIGESAHTQALPKSLYKQKNRILLDETVKRSCGMSHNRMPQNRGIKSSALDSDDSRISQHHIRADPEGLKGTRHVAFHGLHVGQVAASARLRIGNTGWVRQIEKSVLLVMTSRTIRALRSLAVEDTHISSTKP